MGIDKLFLIIVCYLVGMVVGAIVTNAKNKEHSIGYIKFNANNPAKEFLELHIMHDLDIDNPPKHVRLDVVVERGDTNGSISGQVFSRAKDDEHTSQKRY